MKYRTHSISEEDWKVLKGVGNKVGTTLKGQDAFNLFIDWIDDRMLHHSAVKPLLFYAFTSNLIKHRKIKVRKELLDTRIPLLLYIQSGAGKSIPLQALYDMNNNIKRILKKMIPDKEQFARIFVRRFSIAKKQKITAEALLGTVYGKKGDDEDGDLQWIAQLGALGTDAVCVINEAAVFFQSDSENMKNVFPYVCEALDPIGHKANEISKQLTGKPPLWYATETNFILFCQPERANVDIGLITSGTLPRFIVAYSPVSEKFHHDVLKFRMNSEEKTSDIDTFNLAKFFISLFKVDKDFIFTDAAAQQINKEMDNLEEFASREQAAGIYLRASYQRIANMIIKMAAVNCACRYDYKISAADVEKAANDYKAAFITAMVFFSTQNIKGFRMNDRQYLLMQEIELIWKDYDFILPKKVLMARIKGNKKFDVSEKTINNMLNVLHAGRFIYWDRGSGGKKSYIIHPDIPEGEIRNLVMELEEKEDADK